MEKIRLEDALRQYENFLETKGMRLTRQRRTILEYLYNLDCHVSADDLADTLRQTDTGISKATVYRTLSLLEESGLVEANDFRRGYRVYEFAHHKNRHDHILCVDGETVIEFQSEEIEELLTRIARSYGFEPISHTLTIYARCEACRDGDGHTHDHPHSHAHSHDEKKSPAPTAGKGHNEVHVRPQPGRSAASGSAASASGEKSRRSAAKPTTAAAAAESPAVPFTRKRYSDRVSKQEARARARMAAQKSADGTNE